MGANRTLCKQDIIEIMKGSANLNSNTGHNLERTESKFEKELKADRIKFNQRYGGNKRTPEEEKKRMWEMTRAKRIFVTRSKKRNKKKNLAMKMRKKQLKERQKAGIKKA